MKPIICSTQEYKKILIFCALLVLIAILASGCTKIGEILITPTATKLPSPVPTKTSLSTPTATPILKNITFIVFHDYNGNGELDEASGEPLLANVTISSSDISCCRHFTNQSCFCDINSINLIQATFRVSPIVC